MNFILGHENGERVELEVLSYERSPVGDVFDDNWLNAKATVLVDGFHGRVNLAILAGELEGFLMQLRALAQDFGKKALFETLEQQLVIEVSASRTGRLDIRGEIASEPGIGNRLSFSVQLDQSYLPKAIHGLEAITGKFPTRTPNNQS